MMRRNPSSWQSCKRAKSLEEQDGWGSHEDPARARLLDEGLGNLWERQHAADFESTRHRALAEVVGESM
jgi:hypothetical protein